MIKTREIGELFAKDIHRNINGVIKVGQLSEEAVRQELEEYVITRELDRYLRQFYEAYEASLDTPTDKIGVWISGFFGSGKSHFLKILSYLLEDKRAGARSALEIFEEKIPDKMLYAAMVRSAHAPSDIIPFNIDSKADATSKADKEAIVKVLMKVFNDHLGYFGSDLAIADFERTLDKRGRYGAFKAAFEQRTGSAWIGERETWTFVQDEIAETVEEVLGMSAEAARKLVEDIDDDFNLSVDDFAKIVNAYLDAQGPAHRVVFMIDEVGQYIGDNSDLMLNLQTVSEDLGSRCAGRAWVLVTSQEDIDSVTQGRVRGYDFSKIQGRYKNRISLTSANTDEVIRLRLLEKKEAHRAVLEELYGCDAVTLKNQIRFSADTAEMPGFRDANEFALSYPFIPYQFKLLQAVFTKVREMGATGKHLAAGERSMLEAFQLAAQRLSEKPLGTLAPFHLFYDAIEGFLDSPVRRVFENAQDNSRLKSFDVEILQTLFMIRYVKEVRGTVENLTTLSLSDIAQDRLALKEKIEKAVERLEKETLIQRSGDAYQFLTNEEQDVGRELKSAAYDPDPSAITEALQKILWTELFTPKEVKLDKRHSYRFNRKLDTIFYGREDAELELHLVTPYGDHEIDLREDRNAVSRSSTHNEVLVRFAERAGESDLFGEMADYVRTELYLARKNSPGLSPHLRSILQAKAEDNAARKGRIRTLLERHIEQSDVFVKGSKLTLRSSSAADVLTKGLEALINATYSKLGYVKSPFEFDGEVERILRKGGEAQTFEDEPPNALAHADVHAWLSEQDRFKQRVSLRALLNRFGSAPYGWTDLDVVGVLAELVASGKAEIIHPSGVDTRRSGLVKDMRSKNGSESYTLRVPKVVDERALRLARELAKDYFNLASVPHDAGRIFELYKNKLGERAERLRNLSSEANGGNYPFKETIEAHLEIVKSLLSTDGVAAFFDALNARADDFEEMSESFDVIDDFYKNQRPKFDEAAKELSQLSASLRYLEPEMQRNAEEVERILNADDPTRDIRRLGDLLAPVKAQLETRKETAQEEALERWQSAVEQARTLGAGKLDANTLAELLAPLETLRTDIERASTIDAVLASKSRLSDSGEEVKRYIVAQINAQAESRDDSVKNVTGTQNKPRPIVTLKLTRLANKPVLSSGADVNTFLEKLRQTLEQALQEGQDIHLE